MKAYLFWYKMTATSTTEYIYIIAFSYKQACFYWWQYVRNTLGHVYEYDIEPCDIINYERFLKKHKAGEILGANAVI